MKRIFKYLSGALIFINLFPSIALATPVKSQSTFKKNNIFITKENNTILNCKLVTLETYNKSNQYSKVSLKIPVIKGLKNKSLEKSINKHLKEKQLAMKTQIEIESQRDAKYSKDNKIPFNPYELMTTVKINLCNDKILSFSVTYYQYSGGAHGITVVESINVDLTTGKKLALKDVFKKTVDYKNIVNTKIKEEIAKNPDIYFKDENLAFKSIRNDQEFYINNSGVVVYFPLYEIAPYYVGIPEFLFSYNDYKDYFSIPTI